MAKDKTKASTQEHLDIEDITENMVILKGDNVAMIMSTSAVNFDILSEAEQDATIYAYAAFLNSLSFPLQIMIRSKKADITSYYQHLETSMREQPNPDLKRQIQKYMEFIQSTVQQKTILDKQFYLIITFSPLELGIRGLKKQPANRNKSKAQVISEARINLFPKRDHIIKQNARLGLIAQQLSTKELIELFYDIYNPAPTGTQRIILDTASYTAPMVKPAIESPMPAPLPNVGGTPGFPTSPVGAIPIPTFQDETAQQVAQPLQPASQQEALKNLQQATAHAAQFVSQRQQTIAQSQPVAAPPSTNQAVQQPNPYNETQ